MQRQSIGSPSTKLHASGGAAGTSVVAEAPAPEEVKPEKPIRSSYRADRTVHLIPLLTLVCLLVLYLSSHDPSPTDLASFSSSSSLLLSRVDTAGITRHGGRIASGIVSHRALKEDPKLRNRKLGFR